MNLGNNEEYFAEQNEELILNRFEAMLKNNELYFYDVSDLVEIIEIYLDNNNLNMAKLAVEIGLSQHPGSTELLIKKGQLLVEKHDYKKASILLNELKELEPTNPDVYLLLGILNLQQYETIKSIEFFNQAIDLTYDDKIEINLSIAIHFENAKIFHQAIYFLKKAYKIDHEKQDIIY